MSDQDRASLNAPAQDERYFAALAQGVFEIPRCIDCGRWHFFPRACCPYCHSEALIWARPSGAGTIYSTTVVRKPDGGDYCVCLVDLQEGPRLMSTVVGIPPGDVHIGQKLWARVQQGADRALLVFAAEKEAA